MNTKYTSRSRRSIASKKTFFKGLEVWRVTNTWPSLFQHLTSNLHEFILGSQPKLDILAITETSEQQKVFFLHDVEIKGYKISHMASKTSKGGIAVYVNENVNSIERIDLNILHDEFEGTWVEIKNKHSRNIICGCIYRHPHNNFKEFFQYLEMCLSKFNKENKEIFLAGDFNFDLLKTETDTNTQNFYDLMCSYGTLPRIIQLTRVTPNTATILTIFSLTTLLMI